MQLALKLFPFLESNFCFINLLFYQFYVTGKWNRCWGRNTCRLLLDQDFNRFPLPATRGCEMLQRDQCTFSSCPARVTRGGRGKRSTDLVALPDRFSARCCTYHFSSLFKGGHRFSKKRQKAGNHPSARKVFREALSTNTQSRVTDIPSHRQNVMC